MTNYQQKTVMHQPLKAVFDKPKCLVAAQMNSTTMTFFAILDAVECCNTN